ncbi:ATP-dependent Clp protease ATP-binding subunit ClpX [Grifola frondosa]|uniref:ATP-dependent Clp protease ATP-binding subunit ClpX n=1 Tax=Grifola frondosa TaxID=5627 RepID=A0A1C7MK06_GRIFR|nr:ATP-dependent Clp protease ATP-binding subunit ClpX [Grifola frondosa]
MRIFTRSLRTQARYDYVPPQNDVGNAPFFARPAGLATPRQLVQYLDEYVVGQENAKKVLSVAVFNHYNRVHANYLSAESFRSDEYTSEEPPVGVQSTHLYPHPYRIPIPSLQARNPLPLFEKSNVLVIGPTGSGKTLLAKTLAKVLNVPVLRERCNVLYTGRLLVPFAPYWTPIVITGLDIDVGDDVDSCIQRLLIAANWDPHRASMGIVYIDEVDKIARKTGGGSEGTRDVGGEGVQQALLRMMEGSVITVQVKGSPSASPTQGVDGDPRSGQKNQGVPRPDSYAIDTSNVLFILSGAFVGLEEIIKRRVAKGSIGFTANLSSTSEDTSSSPFPFFTPNKVDTLQHTEPHDLVKYGFIPEFISRMPTITTLSPLTPSDLRQVLTEVRGSLVSQYTALFGYSGIEIRFTSAAYDEICRKAAERGGGARGLRGIMESLLLEPMYEAPGSQAISTYDMF